MDNLSPSSPDDVFLNVRRAYRLLHDYQGMVLNAVRYIGSQLDIPYNGGWSRFGETRSGYMKLDQSPWDWLHMVFCEFHFVKTLVPSPSAEGDWLSLSFFVLSDTGYLEENAAVNDKEDLAAFAPPERSSTRFSFILRRTHWSHFYFMEDRTKLRAFMKAEGRLPDDLIARDFVGKSYDMNCLLSEEAANEVVRDVVEFANIKSFPLGLKKGILGS